MLQIVDNPCEPTLTYSHDFEEHTVFINSNQESFDMDYANNGNCPFEVKFFESDCVNHMILTNIEVRYLHEFQAHQDHF